MLSGCHLGAMAITVLITNTLQVSGDEQQAGGVRRQTGSRVAFARTPEYAWYTGW